MNKKDKEDLNIEVAVYLADADRYFNYECAFVDLPEIDRLYYENLAAIAINCIEEWAEIEILRKNDMLYPLK